MADAGEIKGRATLDNAEFLGALKQMVEGSTSATKQASESVSKIGDAVGDVVSAVTKFAAIKGFADFAGDILDTADKTNKLSAAFHNLNGYTDETEKALKDLSGMEFTTMFDFEDTLGPAAKNLMEVGVSAESATKTVKALADAATGMKEGPQYIERVSGTLATMQSKLFATSKDIKALQADGAFSWTALTDVIGGTTEQAMAKVKAGLVSAQDVSDSVTKNLETRWSGQAESVMTGWKGAMHILSESTEDAKVAMGDALKGVLDQLAPILKKVSEAIKEAVEWWNKLSPATKDTIATTVGVTVAVIAAVEAVSGLTAAFKALSLATTANPWGIALAALIAGIVLAVKYIAGLKGAWEALTSGKNPFEGFKTAQAAADAATEAQRKQADALKQTAHEATTAQAELGKSTKTKEQADIAASKAATEHAAAMKASAEEAKKAADIHAKYVEDVNKGYDVLKTASPAAAASYASAMGVVRDETDTVAKLFGTAWAGMSDAMKQTVIDALSLADAYKAMGIAGESSLQAAVVNASKAYEDLSNTAGHTYSDLIAGNDKVVASVKTLADAQNIDIKKAYDAGEMSAQAYYSVIESRAAMALAETQDLAKQGLKTDEDVNAHKIALADATKKYTTQVVADETAMYNSVGLQTQKQLDDAAKKTKELADLYDRLVTPAQRAADAFKGLGVTTLDSQIADVDEFAKKLAKAQDASRDTASDVLALAAAQAELDKKTMALATTIGTKYIDAVNSGAMTAKQASDATIQKLKDQVAQWEKVSDGSTEAQNKIASGQRTVDALLAGEATTDAKNLEQAYRDMGTHSLTAVHDFAVKSAAEFEQIRKDAGDKALATKEAWVTKTKDAYDEILLKGGTLTEGMKSELAKREQDIQNHLDVSKSMWKTAYDGIHDGITTTFDALEKKLVTGQGSFKDIITGLWQDLASSALHAFLEPVETAIANFIAGALADLIGGKGLGGVLDSIKGLGSALSDVFNGAGSAAGAVGGGLKNPLDGLVPDLPGASSGASGAAGSVAGAVGSSLAGIVGAVGSVVSAISGIIGNFQMAHQETTLNAIEGNTKKTALYVGERADGGILGQLFRMGDWQQTGTTPRAVEDLRDKFYDWTGVITPLTKNMTDQLASFGPLFVDIRNATASLRDAVQSLVKVTDSKPQQSMPPLQINVTAQGLTTREVARALGDQIATNMSYQLAGAGLLR